MISICFKVHGQMYAFGRTECRKSQPRAPIASLESFQRFAASRGITSAR